ncbi:MAG: GntR family transcriptional regulator [Anaerolineales bacterium]|nr:GntR family transcriptional regulator [Anaerolineales bacterium]
MSLDQINTEIERESFVPLYYQVIDALVEYIEGNKLEPGFQLPGEAELCRLFDVSRTVIRQALQELEYKGMIYRTKGKGTFVAKPKIHEGLFQELTGFYQDMQARGHTPVSKVLKQEKVPASKKVAAYLEIDEGDPVIQIDRLRFVQEEPIVLVTTYLPFWICPSLLEVDLENRSLYEYLESKHNIQIVRGKRFLEAIAATQTEADLLGITPGAPLILLDSVSYLLDGTPLEYYHALHRGDRSRFETELIRVTRPGELAEKLIEQVK